MQLIGLILLIASSWYIWKLSTNFFDEKTKKELSVNLEKLKIELTKNKKAISIKSFNKAWKRYKDEGGALASKK